MRLILLLLSLSLISCSSCCKQEAPELLPEQLEWLPYEEVQSLQFVNADGDSIKTILIEREDARQNTYCYTRNGLLSPSRYRTYVLNNYESLRYPSDFYLAALTTEGRTKFYLCSDPNNVKIDVRNFEEYTSDLLFVDGIDFIHRTVNGVEYKDVLKLKEKYNNRSDRSESYIARGVGIIEYTDIHDQTWYLIP